MEETRKPNSIKPMINSDIKNINAAKEHLQGLNKQHNPAIIAKKIIVKKAIISIPISLNTFDKFSMPPPSFLFFELLSCYYLLSNTQKNKSKENENGFRVFRPEAVPKLRKY
jgi:hypothetical protein